MTKQLSPLGGTKGKYACLLFDSTLKTVLGTQAHADLFIDILKLLIPDKHITSLTLLNKEYHGLINSENLLPLTCCAGMMTQERSSL